jgi:enoyl-[acyl-carrier protein] reductase II
MRTRLTELLGIEYPVMLAGMGGVSYSELVAAVSEAGGFGCLGASTMGNEKMAQEIAAVRAATGKPFGVDLLTAMPGGMTEQVQLIIEGGASAFVAGLGVPSEVIAQCHDNGLLVVSMCGKVAHALRAVEAGCDIVVAQGTEAGGHTGQVASFPLIPQIVDAVGDRVPVVAAGGIFDGRGLGRHPVHCHPRGSRRPRLQRGASGQPGGPNHHQSRLLRQDHARAAQSHHRPLRRPP